MELKKIFKELKNYEKNKIIIKELIQILENFLIYSEKKNQNIFE